MRRRTVGASLALASSLTLLAPALAVSKTEKAPYDFDFDTGWVPNNSPLQVRLVAKLHSRVQVDMEGTLDATWPEPLTLTPYGTKGKGRISVDEGLQIEAQARFSVSVGGNNYSWSGNIPGIPSVNLLAQGSSTFDPWAWKGQAPPATVTADTPTQKVAQISLTDQLIPIPGISGGFELDGSLGFSATYDSLRIAFDEPSGPPVVDLGNPATRLLLSRAPAVDTSVFVHGEVSRQATVHFIPGFYFTILGKTFNLPIANLPLTLPATAPEPWDFDKVDVHVPLPQIGDVADVDLGGVPVDVATSVVLDVRDLGEERLVLDVATAHPMAFVDTKHALVDPSSSAKVRVVITPDKEGRFDVPVDLASNDPLLPATQVHVRGLAEKKGAPNGPGVGTPASGCGCHAGGRPQDGALGGLTVVALAVLLRRRRR